MKLRKKLRRPGRQRQFLADASTALALRLVAAAANYLSVLLLAKFLVPRDYGQYATIISALTFLAIFCMRGYDITVTRFLGLYEAGERPGMARGLIGFSQRTVLVGSLAVVVPGLIALAMARALDLRDDLAAYAIGLIMLLPFNQMGLQSAVLRIHRKMLQALLPRDVTWRVVQVIAILSLTQLVPPSARLIPFLLISAGALAILWALQLWSMRVSIPNSIFTTPVERDAPAWRRSANGNWLLMTARVSFRSLDVLIVGSLLSLSSAGLYFAVSRTAELMGFVLASLNQVMGPSISRAAAKGDREELQIYLALGSMIVFVPSLMLFAIFIFFGKNILEYFGQQFVDSYSALLLLSIGQLVNAAVGSAGVTLNMTGHERTNAVVLLITAPINLILVATGAHFMGVTGAAFASMVGMIVWNLALWRAASRHTGLETSILSVPILLRLWRRRVG